MESEYSVFLMLGSLVKETKPFFYLKRKTEREKSDIVEYGCRQRLSCHFWVKIRPFMFELRH